LVEDFFVPAFLVKAFFAEAFFAAAFFAGVFFAEDFFVGAFVVEAFLTILISPFQYYDRSLLEKRTERVQPQNGAAGDPFNALETASPI
jgi:hypothetical protein